MDIRTDGGASTRKTLKISKATRHRHLPANLPTNAIFQFDRDTLLDVKGEVQVRWAVVPDPEKCVMDVLRSEADDIPAEKIHQGKWILDAVSLDEIKIDQRMASGHDSDPRHVKRRDDFVAAIQTGKEITPLIVLGADLFLVDGYARYRALKDLNVRRAQVLRQMVE